LVLIKPGSIRITFIPNGSSSYEIDSVRPSTANFVHEDPEKTATRELLEETGYHAREIKEVYTYNPSINISKQLIHVFRGRNLVKGEYEHDRDSIEDIRNVEIVSVEELKRIIIAERVDAGTLIAYLICCTGIF